MPINNGRKNDKEVLLKRVRKNVQAHAKRLKAKGLHRVLVWLPEETVKKATAAAQKKNVSRDIFLREELNRLFSSPSSNQEAKHR